MNNKVLWGIAGVIVVAAAVWFAFSGKKQPTSQQETTNNTTQQSSESTNLKSLFALGTSQKCTYSDATSNSSGTVYVNSGHMRGDFSVQANGATQISHMISDGTTSYMWVEGQSQGFKTSFDSASQANSGNTGSQGNVDPNQNMNYNCSPWTSDSAMFNLPANVQFMDYSGMMKMNSSANASSSTDVNTSSSQEAACNSLPEPAKTQCLQSIQ